jgi:hypothetical protein
LCAEDQSDDDNSEASAESAGGTIDWDIPLKLPRSVLMAAQQAREAEAAASAAVRRLHALLLQNMSTVRCHAVDRYISLGEHTMTLTLLTAQHLCSGGRWRD